MPRTLPLGMSSPNALIGDPELDSRFRGNDRENKPRELSKEKYEPIIFQELFGNSNPVEIEVGCGRGKFLTARAQENPEVNLIGIDRAGRWMKRGIKRAGKQNLLNARFLKTEAKRFLEESIPPESVSVFHIYFPDPWPKRRHNDRRTVNADFLRLLESRLVSGGLVEIATDDSDYFTAIKKSIAATAELWENILETVNERIFGGMMKTNYELKYEAAGKPLFYAELRAA